MKKKLAFTVYGLRFTVCSFFSLCIVGLLCIAPAIVNAQFSLENGNRVFETGGDIQAGYNYEFYPASPPPSSLKNHNFQLDEMRWYFKGWTPDVEYKFRIDFADLINDIQAPANGILDGLKDAWVKNKFKYVDITTGYQLVPYSFNSLVDETDDPFLKREGVINRFYNRRDLGVLASHTFPDEHLTLIASLFSGMGQDVFSTPNPSGKPAFTGRIEYSYPASKTQFVIVDMHDSPVPIFQCAVSGSQANDGVTTMDGNYLINYNGTKTVYGADASLFYKGLSLQFEIQQEKIDSSMISENEQFNYFKEGGYLAEINYYYRPLKSVFCVRYDELNLTDIVYGQFERSLDFAYNYFIKQNALCLKATYEHHLDLPSSGTAWKNDALLVEMQVIF